MAQEIQTIALPILALICSGFVWTMGGYFSNWRKNHNNPEWSGFHIPSLRNDLILGAVLGVSAIVATFIIDGSLRPIADFAEFTVAVGAGFGVVAIVDKYIVGGLLKR